MKEKAEYLHGGDIYHNSVSLDFSVNSNPLGMPRRSIGEAVRGVKLSGQYPDYRGEELCRELAQLPAEGYRYVLGQIKIGNLS
ncbi:MAG: hypothetical protein K2O97_12790, partial [Acetatifactor sp.]|nr:hypothetical protein [Acetatifactor sp.]